MGHSGTGDAASAGAILLDSVERGKQADALLRAASSPAFRARETRSRGPRSAARLLHDMQRRLAGPNQSLGCVAAPNIGPSYCRMSECYPDGAIAQIDTTSADRPRQVAFPACSTRGAVGGLGPT